MDRRTFLRAGCCAAAGHTFVSLPTHASRPTLVEPGLSSHPQSDAERPRAAGIIPVVGDGKWIWTKPPETTGYQEPRSFEFEAGITIEGQGPVSRVKATTVVPVEMPEQLIDDVSVHGAGCQARIRHLAPGAAQLYVSVPSLSKGQVARAVVKMRLTLRKQYFGYERDHFPAEQSFVAEGKQFRKLFLYDSPGIQTRHKEVRDLAAEVGGQIEHPWDKAVAFNAWVWENIHKRVGPYTSALTAVRERVGDCEERAGVFSALCRASGIPTRLVWVPGHCWEEIYLKDHKEQGHWIPVHTSGYKWFGYTGVHELVFQKGDNIYVPEKRKPFRVLEEWVQYQGKRPKTIYYGQLRPVATSTGEDAGPGTRIRVQGIKWAVPRTELNKYFDFDNTPYGKLYEGELLTDG